MPSLSAIRILSLSGTAFRTRDPIVFIETRDGRTVASDSYTYGDALADGVCRPLRFAAIGGTATFQRSGCPAARYAAATGRSRTDLLAGGPR